jgi:hypothetical protein
MVTQFLGTRESKGPRGTLQPNDPRKRAQAKREIGKLENAAGPGKDQALQAVSGGVTFPVFYPIQRTVNAIFTGPPRVYDIKVGSHNYKSYRMVIRRDLDLGEYYGLQGTTWMDPPILKSPDEKKKIGKREYEIFYDGDRVRLVAWRTNNAVYWVSNTLLQTLSKSQMLSIAQTSKVLGR